MQEFANKITTLVNDARPVVIAIVAVALLIDGAMMIYPSERSKEAAKAALPFVAIGSAIALCAVAIADSIGATF